MEASGLRENTIVIVTADHGAAFLDHRFFLHKELHRPLLRVPLLVYDPRNPGGSRRVSSPVSLLDVSPTVMALCGLEASSADEGRPLPAEDGDLPSRPFAFYSQIEDKDVYNGFGWQEGDWKLLAHRLSGSESTVIELFDTASDPEERAPVKSEPQRAAEMAARMRAWFYGAMEGGSTLDLDAEAIENLRALGYVK
jgi:arylsulfatase A-like enzyme